MGSHGVMTASRGLTAGLMQVPGPLAGGDEQVLGLRSGLILQQLRETVYPYSSSAPTVLCSASGVGSEETLTKT